jgi:hypothetical protein
MTSTIRNVVLALGFVVLGVLAIWGWSRKPASAYANTGTNWAAPPYAQPAFAQPMNTPGQPTAYDAQGRALAYASNPCTSEVMYTPPPAYVSRNYVRTIRERPVTETRYVERDRSPSPRYYRERSTKKSAAIVAGSAGAGAAIGALAGGGKGAGIGALAGGAGGFIYDRLTHKHLQ